MTRTLLKTALIASTAALLIAAGPKADLNQDGQVTKAEFTQSAQSQFFAADTDNDNFLSEDERKALGEARRSEHENMRFQSLDTNGDNLISREEMEARAESMRSKKKEHFDSRKKKALEQFDTNLDGELSEAERTVMYAEKKGQRGSREGDRKADGKRGEGKWGSRGKRPNPDANGDGFVSLEEHMALSEQLFARMDANSDGVLTKGEGQGRKGKRGPRRGQ